MLYLQILANGLVLGGLYACIAAGFSLVWGVLNVVNILDPELIVLGGYLATLLQSDPAELGRLVRELTVPSGGVGVRLATAGLGDDRLLVGAAELALAGVLADPGSISELGR